MFTTLMHKNADHHTADAMAKFEDAWELASGPHSKNDPALGDVTDEQYIRKRMAEATEELVALAKSNRTD